MSDAFEVLPHTADLRIRARGRTLEELFANSLRGMSSVMQAEAVSKPVEIERAIEASSPDTAALLVDFLSEALSLAEVHREVYTDVQFQELSDKSLRATLRGGRVPEFAEDIKAVTYHGVEIEETDQGYEATVVYDI